MNKHDSRYHAVVQRINPKKVADAILRTKLDKDGVEVHYKLTDLESVKHVLGLRLNDTTHDKLINSALSS